MKSVFITFDQAYFERIRSTLDHMNCRGFTYLEQVQAVSYTHLTLPTIA